MESNRSTPTSTMSALRSLSGANRIWPRAGHYNDGAGNRGGRYNPHLSEGQTNIDLSQGVENSYSGGY